MEEVIFELGMNWKVGIRNGDTSITDRQKRSGHGPVHPGKMAEF